MPYRVVDADPNPADVRRLTFVPFLENGSCVAIPGADGILRLPSGEVEPGEHYLLDSTLRIPLMTAGYRFQRVTPFAVDDHTDAEGRSGLHAYAWLEGAAPYRGDRPHVEVELVDLPADDLAAAFTEAGDDHLARVVADAAAWYRSEGDDAFYPNTLRLLEPAYLGGTTPEEGSGFGGGQERWRAQRETIVDGIDRDGTFLDVGCANGLLMESVRAWAGESGFTIEPYGVDLGPRLVELARNRLPHWADRIDVGNAIDYVPADGRRFTFVHTLADCVPERRRGDLVRHAHAHLVEPGGRLLLSNYCTRPAREYLDELGMPVIGESGRTAWTDSDSTDPDTT
ncbi:MAG: methyltransferase domain-containing protein [Actinopolymorphaceae bacterium]